MLCIVFSSVSLQRAAAFRACRSRWSSVATHRHGAPAPLFAKKGKGGKGRHVKKGDLPEKTCAACGLPFQYRKKWERCWDEVRYCSERCRREGKRAARADSGSGAAPSRLQMLPAEAPFHTAWRPTISVDRRTTLAALLCLPQAALAKAKPPTAEMVRASLATPDWDSEWPYSKGDFARLDRSADTDFYREPRFVEHVDEKAVAAMEAYLGRVTSAGRPRVLDLCASWNSHLGADFRGTASGLGMNAEELRGNKQLADWVVRDLNVAPPPGEAVLPYPSSSFDVCVISLSIDYLTRPREVMADVARVLKPGGTVHVLFGDRLFITKAVALWTGEDAIQHARTVGEYIHFAGGFADPRVEVLRDGADGSDPLYCVVAARHEEPS